MRDSVEQADASAAWPVGKRWELYARSVYSLRDRTSIENFAGFHFRGNCWGSCGSWRALGQQPHRRARHRLYLQLELNGLSSVGTGADAFLQGSIQGYSAASSNR